MKYKMLVLMLALTVVSWAQTATQTAPATTEQSAAPADTGKSCCDQMSAADKKDMDASCSRHKHHGAGKEMSSCCGDTKAMSCSGKDAKSCMKDAKDKSASCCKGSCEKDKAATACCGDKCAKDGKGCCQSKDMEKATNHCCQHKTRA
jgi:hypothetical protein